MSVVAEFFTQGGAWMYPIAFMSIISIAIIVERSIFLFGRYNIDGNAFMAEIQNLVMSNNIDRAIKVCNASNRAALPKVIKAGLTRANKGEIEIQNAVEEATLEVIPVIQKRTNSLQAVANLATLMGLLGTIIGLIMAFKTVEAAAADQRAEALTQAIAIAMNTTAFGLMVAIPTMGAHVILAGITKKIIDEIDQYSVKLENLLISRGRGGQSPLAA